MKTTELFQSAQVGVLGHLGARSNGWDMYWLLIAFNN